MLSKAKYYVGAVLAAALALFVFLFKNEREKRIESEVNADYKAKDAVLAEKQANVETKIEAVKKEGEDAKSTPASQEDILDSLKNL